MRTDRKPIAKNKPVRKLYDLFLIFVVYLKQQKLRFTINCIVLIFAISTGAILIWMLGQGANALYNKEFNLAPDYLLAFCSLFLFLQTLRFLNAYYHEAMQQEVIHAIRHNLYQHIFKLSIPFKNTQPSGDLLTRLGQDINSISRLVVLLPSHLISYILTAIFYTGLLFYIDPLLAVISLLFIPIFLIQQGIFLGRTRKSSRLFLSFRGKMGSFEEESINNILGIVTFNAESLMVKKFNKLFRLFRKAAMRNLLLHNLFNITFELLAAAIAIVLVTIGLYRIKLGLLTIGDMVNFILYLVYLVVPIRGLASLPMRSQIQAGAAERVSEILDKKAVVKEKDHPVALKSFQGKIHFRHVSFHYDKSPIVISDLEMDIEPGEFIGIVGASGVGKSTLAMLLLRVYDPTSGSIHLDNINIRELSLNALRKQISVVWQDPFILDDTIMENIRLAAENCSDKDIIKASKAAYAHSFIKNLPHGYNTILGSSGNMLSGGQKQRIALAQAFVRQTPIIILDEATASLDSYSEQEIKKTLRNLKRKCTLLVIAHRYSTLEDADRIIYMNGDSSVTIGTLQDLEKSHLPFRKIIKHQYRGDRLES